MLVFACAGRRQGNSGGCAPPSDGAQPHMHRTATAWRPFGPYRTNGLAEAWFDWQLSWSSRFAGRIT